MMEKEEEGGSSGNNHKAQVILHLQPLLHGGNYDIADTSSTVLAIETQHDDSKSEGENVEYGYPITCGESRAVLLFKKFVCPGINVRCVKFNDQLISPKQFVHLAGKATLKDWKRAIRLGGVMLRKMMDSGQIDFYQHATVCSNTCRSTKFDMLINSSQLPLGTSVPNPSSVAFESLGGQVPPLTGESLHDAADLEESLDDRFGGEWSSAHLTTANGHPKRKRNDTPDGILSLWKGVAECGLMGEVLSGLQAHLLTALKGVEVRSEKAELQETDAIILNSLCEMFGLLDSVKQALEQRRSQKEDDDDDDDDDGVYGLEELSKERRKQACVKSTSYKHASPKHLRPQRHQPSNSQLSPTLSNTVIQPLSLTGLPEPPYTHPNINPQHVSHFPTSGGPRAGHVRREERTRALCESGKHARARKAGQELTFEMQQDLEQRVCKLQAQLGSEKLGEAERLHGCEKVAMGRKGLKKLKTK